MKQIVMLVLKLLVETNLSFFVRRLTIKTTVIVFTPETVILKYIQHTSHLAEN